MFQAPRTVQAEVFARYPDALRTATPANEWNRGQPAGLGASSFLEGPSFDRAGVLWCVDIVNGRILNVDRAGNFSIAVEYDGWPNGLKIRDDGLVFIADCRHGIMVHEPGSRAVKPYLPRAGLERFKGVNDLFFARGGDLYFTDQGMTGLHDPSGRLFRLKPDGRLDCLLSNVPSPNGVVMDLHERAVLLAVTRANAVWKIPLSGSGVTKAGLFLPLMGGLGPDGLALDASGGLAVAHAGLGTVWLFDAQGEPLLRVRTPGGLLSTNIAYGGEQNAELFITESASAQIFRVRMPLPGKPLFSHR
ncbi:SMP-30/gluconolactonase/LRE family protein [Bordetella bronchialis]|uniref:Gluconolactonase n=1 Tax=Bordetella bronchialis TaxID=463025 RepID=A0A193FT74_9BORD|nr:SMP-30/gluconolactonase/LRE family protein [Bordetella bronchialis]ANN70957.1 gluconolactonase [Bordetella bronchialis]